MPNAKVRNLKVRPLQSADLCFEVDGIMGEQNAQMPMLGLPVVRFDFATFYAKLGVENNAADPGRLKYDSQTIRTDPSVVASLLFALRAESTKAMLDKVIAARENSFYQKYKNQAAIIAQMQAVYSAAAGAASKPSRLSALQAISQNQHDALAAAYTTDARTGVVKTTTSAMTNTTNSSGTSKTASNGTVDSSSTNTGTQNSTSKADSSGKSGSSDTSSHTDGSASSSTNGSGTDKQLSSGTTDSTSTGLANQVQSTANTDYGYRHPNLENEAQYQRAQVSLIDETFSQFMLGQNLPLLDRVFTNELRAIDLDVKRLQIGYLNTILMSPMDGVVTGVFKNLGDCVKAGEPVIRVENTSEVFLVGTLIFRGLVTVGSKVSITTRIFDSPAEVTVSGTVVSVRGHDSADDEWNVLVRCPNSGAGAVTLPANYNFDYDDTTVTIS